MATQEEVMTKKIIAAGVMISMIVTMVTVMIRVMSMLETIVTIIISITTTHTMIANTRISTMTMIGMIDIIVAGM
jgi:hypothetical protein